MRYLTRPRPAPAPFLPLPRWRPIGHRWRHLPAVASVSVAIAVVAGWAAAGPPGAGAAGAAPLAQGGQWQPTAHARVAADAGPQLSSLPAPPLRSRMDESWLGGLVVSPHIVNEGQVVDMQISGPPPWKGGCIGSNGKECVTGYDWQWPGEKVAGCGSDDTFCDWKATAGDAFGTPQWSIVQVGIGNYIGGADSQDYFYVLVKGRAISGTVLSTDGKPLAGQEVDVSGPTSGHVVTNADGFYDALVRPGSYSVTVGGQKDVSVGSCGPNGSVAEDSCRLDLSSDSGAADFTVGPPQPKVTGLSVHAGPACGGTELFVLGSGFKGTSSVDFVQANGTKAPAQLLGRVADSSLLVRVPDQTQVVKTAGKDAVEDVVVTVGSVTSSKETPADRFTFQWPQVASVEPPYGPAKGKEALVLSGSGFDGAKEVDFEASQGGKEVVLKSVVPSSVTDHRITVEQAPDLAPWVAKEASSCSPLPTSCLAVDVVVVVPGTRYDFSSPVSQPADQYRAIVPYVSSVDPNQGPMEGADVADVSCAAPPDGAVVVEGEGFTGADEVLLSYPGETKSQKPLDAPATVCSDKRLVFVPPDASDAFTSTGSTNPIVADITVSVPVEGDPFGLLSPLSDADHYTIYPVKVTGVSPAVGPVGGGQVVISGVGFSDVKSVRFEYAGNQVPSEEVARVVSSTPTSITVKAPDMSAQAVSRPYDGLVTDVRVEVQEPDGQLVTTTKSPSDQFLYAYPKISRTQPATALAAGHTTVQVFGQGFLSDSPVSGLSARGTEVSFEIGGRVVQGRVIDVSSDGDVVTVATPDVTGLMRGATSVTAHVTVSITVAGRSYSSQPDATSASFTFTQ